MTAREFDIVVYGVTGIVGKLTAEYLAHAGGKARIALADPDRRGIDRVRLPITFHRGSATPCAPRPRGLVSCRRLRAPAGGDRAGSLAPHPVAVGRSRRSAAAPC